MNFSIVNGCLIITQVSIKAIYYLAVRMKKMNNYNMFLSIMTNSDFNKHIRSPAKSASKLLIILPLN